MYNRVCVVNDTALLVDKTGAKCEVQRILGLRGLCGGDMVVFGYAELPCCNLEYFVV